MRAGAVLHLRILRVLFALGVLGSLSLDAPTVHAGDVRLDFEPGRGVVLSGLPETLAHEDVRKQLMTGLTTTFLFRLEPQRRDVPAGARVTVRYELWDEVFHIDVLTADDRSQRAIVPSFAELKAWWKQLRLLVLGPVGRPTTARDIRVVLDVIPFSQAERDDTQRWFSETVGAAAQSGTEETERSPNDREESLGRVLSVMIATSIQRRALTSYEWTVQLPLEGSP